MTKTIEFERDGCVRCGRCAAACPGRLIVQKTPMDYPETVDEAGERCISCNHCVAVCPSNAVTVAEIKGSQCDPIRDDSLPRFDQVAALVRSRRSIRRYDDSPLDEREIERLLNVARWAPSAKNGLPVRWLVVNGREKVVELEAIVMEWFATLHGMQEMIDAWKNGDEPIFRGAPCVIAAYTEPPAIWPEVDATIAVETLDLCVAAMRLGSCWAGFFIQAAKKYPKINQWLGLKPTDCIQAGLMIGRIGNEDYRKIPYRPDVSIHWVR